MDIMIREERCFSCICTACKKEDNCTKRPCYNKEKEINPCECEYCPVWPLDCDECDYI